MEFVKRAVATLIAWTVKNRYLLFSLRLVLGTILVVAAIGKLPQQAELVDLVKSLAILPQPWAHYYAVALPWAELVVGVVLILGLFSRLAAGVSILMTASFIVANVKTIVTSTYNPTCGCFGQIVETPSWVALTIDSVMIVMALMILFHSGEFLSIDSWLARRKAGAGTEKH